MSEQESGQVSGQVSEQEKEAIEYIKAFQKDLYGASEKNLMAIYIDRVWNYIERLQKELEKKTTILMAGADKVKQLEKENQELKEENIILEGNKIGYKLAIQEIKEKIENEIKELEENEDFYREHDRMCEYEGKINLLKRLLVKE